MNMTGDRLYYVNVSDGSRIYRVKTDGSERECIVSDSADMLQVAGDRIFYQSKADGGLYSAGLDGSGKLRIVKDRVSCFTLSNGVIYYRNDSEGGALWCCSIDGFDAQELAAGSCNYPAVYENNVYYINVSDDSICRVSTQGGEPETVVSSGVRRVCAVRRKPLLPEHLGRHFPVQRFWFLRHPPDAGRRRQAGRGGLHRLFRQL